MGRYLESNECHMIVISLVMLVSPGGRGVLREGPLLPCILGTHANVAEGSPPWELLDRGGVMVLSHLPESAYLSMRLCPCRI